MTKEHIPPSGVAIAGSCDLVVRLRLKNCGVVWEKMRHIVSNMYDRNLLPKDKFHIIVLVFLHGLKTSLVPTYERISKKDMELGINVELDSNILLWADKHDLELLKEIYLIATCEAVLHVLRKYKLPTEPVETLRKQYGNIPQTIEECEARLQK